AVWGLWHGVGLALERRWLDSCFMTTRHPAVLALRMLLVFAFVTIGWLFFKLQDIGHAAQYLRAMFASPVHGLSAGAAFLIALSGSAVGLYPLAALARCRIPAIAKDVAYGVMLFLVVTSAGSSTPFIYFQF